MSKQTKIAILHVLALLSLFAACWLACCGCSVPLDTWNPPKTGYVDELTGCPRYMHATRGPDEWDRSHGQPYHCEKPQYDPDNLDIDPTAE